MSVFSHRLMVYVSEELEDSRFKLGESSVCEHLVLRLDHAELQTLPLRPDNFIGQLGNLAHSDDLSLFFIPSHWIGQFKRSTSPELIQSKIQKGDLKVAAVGPRKDNLFWNPSHLPFTFLPTGMSESFSAALIRQFIFGGLPGLSSFFEKDAQLVSDTSVSDKDLGSKLDLIIQHFDFYGLFSNKSHRLDFHWKFIHLMSKLMCSLDKNPPGKNQRASLEIAADKSVLGFSIKWSSRAAHDSVDFFNLLNQHHDLPLYHFALLQEVLERQEFCLNFLVDGTSTDCQQSPLSKEILSNQKLEKMRELGLLDEPDAMNYLTVRNLPKRWQQSKNLAEEALDLEKEKESLLLERNHLNTGTFIDHLLALMERYKERISTLNRKYGLVSQEKKSSDQKISQLENKLKSLYKEKRNLGLSTGNIEERPEKLKKRIEKLERDNKELSKKIEDKNLLLEKYEKSLSEYDKYKARSKKGNQAA